MTRLLFLENSRERGLAATNLARFYSSPAEVQIFQPCHYITIAWHPLTHPFFSHCSSIVCLHKSQTWPLHSRHPYTHPSYAALRLVSLVSFTCRVARPLGLPHFPVRLLTYGTDTLPAQRPGHGNTPASFTPCTSTVTVAITSPVASLLGSGRLGPLSDNLFTPSVLPPRERLRFTPSVLPLRERLR